MNFYEQLFCRGRTTGEGMTHFERLFAAKFGGSPPPEVREYTGAVPVTITADGTPLIDYLISGNTVQSGTPTPDNPIMPQGTGERTANLWDATKYYYTSLSENSIWIYSTNLTGSVYRIPCKPNTTYTLYLAENVDITIWRMREVSTDVVPNATSKSVPTTGTYASSVPDSKSTTFTTSASAKYILFQTNESAYDSVLPVIMLIEGTTKIPYEPYGYKIPISSAGQTTPVYLGEVETSRKIGKAVFKGDETENWGYSSSGNNARVFLPVNSMGASPSVSTHYRFEAIRTYPNLNEYCINNASALVIGVDINNITSAADFKAYLAQQYSAGTPVTVWYVLATEETGIVNEPLMRIGDYADTLSKEQAGVQIPTNNGTTVIDVDTTVKPSEVYIKYMG